MKSPEIRKAVPLREQVYAAILSQLRSGAYSPGERITEERVARDLDVSRTPVREAISQLHQNGLLSSRERGGYVVPSLTVAEVVEIFEVRKLVEPHAVLLATREFGDKELAALDKAIKQETKAASSKNPDSFAAANEGFRVALFDSLSNGTLTGIIAQFGHHLQFIRMLTLKDISLRKDIVKRQKAIRDAIARRDETAAPALWEEYLSFAQAALVSAMEESQ